MDFKILLQGVISLFAIINPLGNLPIFEGLLEGATQEIKRKTYSTAVLFAFLTISGFTFFGLTIMEDVFGITLNEFRLAGGIILITLAVKKLVFQSKKNMKMLQQMSENDALEIAVTPIACPLLIGPGSILTSILIMKTKGPFIAFSSIFLVSVCIYIIFKFSDKILGLLGKFGSILISRIMQIFITAIGVHYIISAIKEIF